MRRGGCHTFKTLGMGENQTAPPLSASPLLGKGGVLFLGIKKLFLKINLLDYLINRKVFEVAANEQAHNTKNL